jgi:hypothetical protein
MSVVHADDVPPARPPQGDTHPCVFGVYPSARLEDPPARTVISLCLLPVVRSDCSCQGSCSPDAGMRDLSRIQKIKEWIPDEATYEVGELLFELAYLVAGLVQIF